MTGTKFVISRFATLTWSGGKGMLVSSLTARYLELVDDSQFSMLGRFRTPLALSALNRQERSLAKVLIAGGLLVPSDGREERETHALWEPHDLGFHVLSRQRRKPEVRLLGKRPPEKLFTARSKGEAVPLARPGADTIGSSRPFWEILEARTSTRAFSPVGLSLSLLGHLLFFSARSKGVSRDETLGDTDHRSYPSGGGRYPLEIYLVLPPKACAGLRAGIYHYRPKQHALERMAGFGAAAKEFVQRAIISSPPLGAERGWLLVAISARIGRTAWKYDSIAYSVILKEVGSLMQTLYLAAGALGLGACALGGGSLDLLARVTGVDALVEPQVGEMAIGPVARR